MPFQKVPFGEIEAFNVVIEVPTGSAKKYAYDPEMDALKLSQVLYDNVGFPFNYGYVAETESGDGENLDAFVLSTHPLATGTVVTCRAIGLIELIDRGQEDHKVIAVPLSEHRFDKILDIKDLPVEHIPAFEDFYRKASAQWKKDIQVKGFFGRDRAVKELLRTQILD
ncbi:MAG: inorganic diphosphatase [Patescibacteria group bacterium]|nr:inorganic diphosphatase [Patescibacteria group bacterium]